MEIKNSKERYYKRVKERHLWVKLGLPLFVFGFGCIIFSISAIFFNVSFTIVRVGSSIGFGGIAIGGFSMVLFGRLGWSESKLIDLLLNRLSTVLIIGSQLLAVIHLSLGYTSEIIQKDLAATVVGVVFSLLGIFFNSPPVDASRVG